MCWIASLFGWWSSGEGDRCESGDGGGSHDGCGGGHKGGLTQFGGDVGDGCTSIMVVNGVEMSVGGGGAGSRGSVESYLRALGRELLGVI